MDGPLRPMEDDIEADYLRIERAGIMDEGYWAAINGLDFEEDAMTALVKAFATTQDWLYSHIKKHLELKGAYT